MAGLHIDYRPRAFDEIIGNEKTIQAVKNILSKTNKPHTFLFTGPSGCGKCVTGDTLILTDKGIEKIKDYSSDVSGFTEKEVPIYSFFNFQNSSHFFEEDSKETIEITDSLGIKIRGTYEHPLLVLGVDGRFEFRNLQEIKEGDILCIKRGMNVFNKDSFPINFEYIKNVHDSNSDNHKMINIPKEMTPDLARLLGYITANGSFDKKHIQFSSKNVTVKEDICKIIYRYGQKIGKVRDGKDYVIGASQFGEFIRYLFDGNLGTARFKKVPKCVLQGSEKIQTNYLRSLIDCDGYSRKNILIEYYTASKTLCDQVHFMLLNLGIVGKKKEYLIKKYNHTYHSITISGDNYDKYLSTIGSLKYQITREIKRNTNKDVIPNLSSILLEKLYKIRENLKVIKSGKFKYEDNWKRFPVIFKSYNYKKKDITYSSLKEVCYNLEKLLPYDHLSEDMIELCRLHLDHNYFYSRVVKKDVIEDLVKVYDFTIPYTHAFVSNGLISHNTTIGRIVAKELGCEDTDYQELDIGDFRGIDTVREIRRNMVLKPMAGTCRVWVLDEVHKLTSDAQSALLKALEDTPNHVYFILCTTDPEKLLDTIKSRCTTFTMSSLTEDQIRNLLIEIAEAEGAKVPDKIISLIAERSNGQPRHALVELDKVIGLKEEAMEKALSQMDNEYAKTIDLCRALAERATWNKVASILDSIKDEPERVRRAILGYFDKVLRSKDKGMQARAYLIMVAFKDANVFYLGKPALSIACYEALYSE